MHERRGRGDLTQDASAPATNAVTKWRPQRKRGVRAAVQAVPARLCRRNARKTHAKEERLPHAIKAGLKQSFTNVGQASPRRRNLRRKTGQASPRASCCLPTWRHPSLSARLLSGGLLATIDMRVSGRGTRAERGGGGRRGVARRPPPGSGRTPARRRRFAEAATDRRRGRGLATSAPVAAVTVATAAGRRRLRRECSRHTAVTRDTSVAEPAPSAAATTATPAGSQGPRSRRPAPPPGPTPPFGSTVLADSLGHRAQGCDRRHRLPRPQSRPLTPTSTPTPRPPARRASRPGPEAAELARRRRKRVVRRPRPRSSRSVVRPPAPFRREGACVRMGLPHRCWAAQRSHLRLD